MTFLKDSDLIVFIEELEFVLPKRAYLVRMRSHERPHNAKQYRERFPAGRSYRVSFSRGYCNRNCVSESAFSAYGAELHVLPLDRPAFQRCLADGRRRELGWTYSVETGSCRALD
jgi:hypothetical protein